MQPTEPTVPREDNPPVPAVRCFRGAGGIWIVKDGKARWFNRNREQIKEAKSPLGYVKRQPELSPDAALAELADWPEAQRELRRMMREGGVSKVEGKVLYNPPCPDLSLSEQVRHARGFANGICRNDPHVSGLLLQMARSIEELERRGNEVLDEREGLSVLHKAALLDAVDLEAKLQAHPTPLASVPVPDAGERAGLRERPQWALDEAYRIICEHPWGWEESASDELTSDQEEHQIALADELVKIVDARVCAPLRSLGMPDDADAGEWVRSKIDDLQDRIDAIKGELSNEQPRQAEEFAKRIKAGDDPLAVVREAMSEYKAFYNLSCEFREEDCRKRYNAEQSLQAAEAKATELSRELESVKAERDELAKWKYLTQCHAPYEAAIATLRAQREELQTALTAAQARIAELEALNEDKFRHLEAYRKAASEDKARIEELERMRIIDNNAKCTCWSKAPTVPTFRDQNKHLNDCPMRDSGLPVGVNADMGGGASLVCIPRDEYDALQAERAALAERIRGIKCDEPEVDSFSRCYANGFRDALEAAAQLAEPKGGGEHD